MSKKRALSALAVRAVGKLLVLMEPKKQCSVKTLRQLLRLTLRTITLHTRFLRGMAAIAAPPLRDTVHAAAPTATLPRPPYRQGFFNLLGRHHAVLEAIAHLSEDFTFFCQ
jgi:hypothetical protein